MRDLTASLPAKATADLRSASRLPLPTQTKTSPIKPMTEQKPEQRLEED